MTRYAMLCAALLLAFPAAAQDQAPPVGVDPGGNSAPTVLDRQSNPDDFDLARKKVLDCDGEQFVFAWGAGANPTKVTLCSKKDATPDEVVRMLEEAATRIERSTIAEDRRVAIAQQIRAKISELTGSATAHSAPLDVPAAPVAVQEPAAVVEAPVAVPEPVARPAIAPPVQPRVTPVAARPVLPARPRLTYECYTPGDIGSGGPCVMLERDTLLTLTARDALPGGARLRFIRNGDLLGEVALGALRKGQSLRLALPSALCAGIAKSQTSIEVTRGGQVVDSIGPYLLRC